MNLPKWQTLAIIGHNLNKTRQMRQINIAIFISGSGSLLPSFFALEKDHSDLNVPCIVASKDCEGVNKAMASGKEVLVTSNFDQALIDYLQDRNVEAICLAGFLKILPADFIRSFPGKIFNIHPSLLPKFGGKGMYGKRVHQAVTEAGETETGFTIHEVTEVVDEGDIIFQQIVPINKDESSEEVAEKVQSAEKENYAKVIYGFLKEFN